MTLEEQHRFLLTACTRFFPRWLQSRTSPEDIAQECLLDAWSGAQRGQTITEGLLTAIARQRTIDAWRWYRTARRFGQVPLPDHFDAPFPDREREPDWDHLVEAVVAVIGRDRWLRLLHNDYRSYNGHRSAIHKAKKMIQEKRRAS